MSGTELCRSTSEQLPRPSSPLATSSLREEHALKLRTVRTEAVLHVCTRRRQRDRFDLAC